MIKPLHFFSFGCRSRAPYDIFKGHRATLFDASQ